MKKNTQDWSSFYGNEPDADFSCILIYGIEDFLQVAHAGGYKLVVVRKGVVVYKTDPPSDTHRYILEKIWKKEGIPIENRWNVWIKYKQAILSKTKKLGYDVGYGGPLLGVSPNHPYGIENMIIERPIKLMKGDKIIIGSQGGLPIFPSLQLGQKTQFITSKDIQNKQPNLPKIMWIYKY